MPVVYKTLLGLLGPPYRLLNRVRAEGLGNVPEGGAVLVFNHPRLLDPGNVVSAWRRPLYFLGKKEVFDLPVVGWILRDLGGQIPLDRSKGGNDHALDEAVERLHAGDKVALAPEGTTQDGARLGRGRRGAVRLALKADVPIVPVALHYPHPHRPDCRVVFGTPVDLSPWKGRGDDPMACRAATDAVMTALAAMLGQDYDPTTAPDYALQKGFKKAGRDGPTDPLTEF